MIGKNTVIGKIIFNESLLSVETPMQRLKRLAISENLSEAEVEGQLRMIYADLDKNNNVIEVLAKSAGVEVAYSGNSIMDKAFAQAGVSTPQVAYGYESKRLENSVIGSNTQRVNMNYNDIHLQSEAQRRGETMGNVNNNIMQNAMAKAQAAAGAKAGTLQGSINAVKPQGRFKLSKKTASDASWQTNLKNLSGASLSVFDEKKAQAFNQQHKISKIISKKRSNAQFVVNCPGMVDGETVISTSYLVGGKTTEEAQKYISGKLTAFKKNLGYRAQDDNSYKFVNVVVSEEYIEAPQNDENYMNAERIFAKLNALVADVNQPVDALVRDNSEPGFDGVLFENKKYTKDGFKGILLSNGGATPRVEGVDAQVSLIAARVKSKQVYKSFGDYMTVGLRKFKDAEGKAKSIKGAAMNAFEPDTTKEPITKNFPVSGLVAVKYYSILEGERDQFGQRKVRSFRLTVPVQCYESKIAPGFTPEEVKDFKLNKADGPRTGNGIQVGVEITEANFKSFKESLIKAAATRCRAANVSVQVGSGSTTTPEANAIVKSIMDGINGTTENAPAQAAAPSPAPAPAPGKEKPNVD